MLKISPECERAISFLKTKGMPDKESIEIIRQIGSRFEEYIFQNVFEYVNGKSRTFLKKLAANQEKIISLDLFEEMIRYKSELYDLGLIDDNNCIPLSIVKWISFAYQLSPDLID